MSFLELLLIAIALSMDAFTVAMCKGLGMKKLNYKYTITLALCFGFFQAVMPFLGWAIGVQFQDIIVNVDHWVAFLLLVFIGGKMAVESLKTDETEDCTSFDFKELILMGIATSIDALAVGVSFAVLPNVNISFACLVIGGVCFVFSVIAVIVGQKFGEKFKINTELIGGIILIGIGVKILVEHLFFV